MASLTWLGLGPSPAIRRTIPVAAKAEARPSAVTSVTWLGLGVPIAIPRPERQAVLPLGGFNLPFWFPGGGFGATPVEPSGAFEGLRQNVGRMMR